VEAFGEASLFAASWAQRHISIGVTGRRMGRSQIKGD
jgi:hypothetical protein